MTMDLAPKTLYGCYSSDYVSTMNTDDNAEYIYNRKVLRAQTKTVYKGIYADDATYLEDDVGNDSDDSMILVNLVGGDSEEDSDFYISDDSGDLVE